MLNAILFTVVLLWLIALSVQQSHVTNWFKTLQDERSRMLDFIDETKASLNKNSQQEKEQ